MRFLGIFLILLLYSSFGAKLWATSKKTSSCAQVLQLPQPDKKDKSFEFWFSNMNSQQQKDLIEDFKDSLETARLLGYRVPDQQFILMSGDELMKFVANMGPAAPHWIDGWRLMQRKQFMGVMEFVETGHMASCSFCRSFYDESIERVEQQSIADHVMGHNHVSESSRIGSASDDFVDRIRTRAQRVHSLQQAYQQYDRDEVSLYVQFLFSLGRVNDLVGGVLDKVEALQPRPTEQPQIFNNLRDPFDRPVEKKQIYNKSKTPPRPTASVPQAMVANLSPTTQDWQKQLLGEEEHMSRAAANFSQTRILNEGWATFSQQLLLRHRKDKGTNKAIRVGQLVSSIKGPTIGEKFFNNKNKIYGRTLGEKYLGNVYWLGFEAWMNLWKNFYKRPEIQALKTDLKKDQAFVQYATGIIENYNDAQFLRIALDDNWILRHRLNLSRPIVYEEYSKYNIDIFSMRGSPFLVLSTSPERIRQQIVRRYTNKSLEHPRIFLKDLNHQGEEVLYEQEIFNGWPVEPGGAAQMLYLLGHFHEKTVSLRTGLAPLSLLSTLWDELWYHGKGGVDRGERDRMTFFTVSGLSEVASHLKQFTHINENQLGPGDLYALSPATIKEALKSERVQKLIQQLSSQKHLPSQMLDVHHKIRQALSSAAPGASFVHRIVHGGGITPVPLPGIIDDEFRYPLIKLSIMQKALINFIEKIEVLKILIRVRPSGQVEVELLDTSLKLDKQPQKQSDEAAEQHPEDIILDSIRKYIKEVLQVRLQKAVDAYKADLYVNLNQDKIDLEQSKYAPVLAQMTQIWLTHYQNTFSDSPLADEAVLIFQEMIKRRTDLALNKIFQTTPGKTSPGRATSRGMAVRAFPIIPVFQLDPKLRRMRHKLAYAREDYSIRYPWLPLLMDDLEVVPPYAQQAFVDDVLNTLPSAEVDDHVDIGQGDWLTGEVFYRPNSSSGDDEGDEDGDDEGDGDGDGDDDGEGEYGEDEGKSEDNHGSIGGGGVEPGEVIIPYKLWGQVLKQHFELPNTRKTRSGEERTEMRYAGSYHRDDEPLLINPTLNEAFEEGIARFHSENPDKDLSELSLEDEEKMLTEGLAHLDPNRYVTRAYQPKPIPEFKAVLVIDEDMSGSMSAPGIKKIAKNFAYNVLALLRANYTSVDVVFIGHSHFAQEFKEKDFWKATIDGGTEDSTGFKLSYEIMTKRYPKSQYNRYFLSIGDAGNAEADNPVALHWLEKIYPEIQHGVYVTVNHYGWGWTPDGSNPHYDNFAKTHKWFDTVSITRKFSSFMKAFEQLYAPGRK